MYTRNDKPTIITDPYRILYAISWFIFGFNKHIIRDRVCIYNVN